MRNLVFLFLIGLFFSTGIHAQYKPKKSKKQFYGNQRLQKPLYRWVTGDYAKHGIQFSFGPTYTFTSNKAREGEFRIESENLGADSIIRYSQEAKSRIGVFAELGMVHITRKPRKIIHYYDWGIGFKLYGGREASASKFYDNRDTLIGGIDGEGKFYNGYLYGRFSAHNVFQINPNFFLDNALGVNFDYAIMNGNMAYDGFRAPVEQKFQGDFLAQLHYSLGLGIKPRADKGFFFVPSVEIPFLGIHEWNGGSAAINWFSSKYHPAMLKLKFVWLFKRDPERCPPVEINVIDKRHMEEQKNK
ncbi:hypothetical protein [Brumimicrobium oceani]|uniref:Uncharacterized protein n=1 Tax=Brumimicrobium oceani TaxID=2100725 RepID=A0A2U2XCN8_9FLAO|nr:hypothetical protein [Brumimicrobium oceani]PWH85569.1 hypothetical protein DIT68_07980 [Brumimicrobium oceani]